MKCPVKTNNGQIDCDYEFVSGHYSDIQPHLETHSVYDLARSMTRLMYDLRWADTMAKKITECCETLLIRGDRY